MSTSKQAKDKLVIVGMSGGVDSSVAALLLLQQNFRVEGLFMKNWEEDDGTEYCTSAVDLNDAKAVCQTLGIKLHQANFATEYWDQVFEHCLDELRLGRTPNPDILCNKRIKFDSFLDYALTHLGADAIATGHYANLRHEGRETWLLRGVDVNKDQTYFLHEVSEHQLRQVIFPLGGLTKREVRALARKAGLATHDKKDSTGICFIGERNFTSFLQRYLPTQPGKMVDTEGRAVGTHKGLMYYTIGQRQGLHIGGMKNCKEAPWYVVAKNPDQNLLVVAQGNDHPELFAGTAYLKTVHWINEPGMSLPYQAAAKCRYRQADQNCVLKQTDTGYRVDFDQPQRALTPGQSICLYNHDRCLGGGVIEACA